MSTPIYEEHSCPVCAPRRPQGKNAPHLCADCGKTIPSEATEYAYKNMAGCGFKSHTYDHRHIKDVKGITGFGWVPRELCLECVRIDFQKVYPEVPLSF